MLARLEENDNGQAARFIECPQPPALVRPDIGAIRRNTGMAVDASFTAAWLLALDGWLQGPRAHGPVERPRVPLLERRHVQIPADPLPELLRRLGHGHRG